MVLFVSVWAVVKSAVTAVLIETVTSPVVPPPDKPVPAVTAVISNSRGREKPLPSHEIVGDRKMTEAF